MAQENLYNKYRPQTWDDVVEQDAIKQILNREIQTNNLKHVLLFTGGAGTGKTTSARIFANMLEKEKSNIYEINCADHTGVDDVRQLILDPCRTKPLVGMYKIFVLDECFYENTLVKTIEGNKKIKDIQVGDIVYTMDGCNKVEKVLCHNIPLHRLCLVTINGVNTITTKDHLYFTQNGWVEARYLKEGDVVYDTNTIKENFENMSELSTTISGVPRQKFQDILLPTMSGGVCTKKEKESTGVTQYSHQTSDMCNMWDHIYDSQTNAGENMFSTMQNKVNFTDRTHIYAISKKTNGQKQKFHPNEKQQSDVECSDQTKDDKYKKNQWYFKCLDGCKGWQRTIYQGTTPITATIRPGLGIGVSGKNGTFTKDISLAYQLQIRPCLSKDKIGDRGGWQRPQIEKGYISRCKKRALFNPSRVEGVEIYQSTNSYKFRQCGITDQEIYDGYVRMYDLQIQNCPTYFANNILVHNCHMLTVQSQNALLKVLEEPPKHCIFIMCTTDPQKILSTILSRSFRYDFQLISNEGIINRLKYILQTEKNLGDSGCGVNTWDDSSLEAIASASKGHLRDSLTILQKCISYSPDINIDVVTKVLGVTNYGTLFDILDSILDNKQTILIESLKTLNSSGMDLKLFIKNFLTFVLDINKFLILKTETNDLSKANLNIPISYANRLTKYNVGHKDKLKHLLKVLLELNSSIRWETNVAPVLETNLLLETM